jgi:hypothetical protein
MPKGMASQPLEVETPNNGGIDVPKIALKVIK